LPTKKRGKAQSSPKVLEGKTRCVFTRLTGGMKGGGANLSHKRGKKFAVPLEKEKGKKKGGVRPAGETEEQRSFLPLCGCKKRGGEKKGRNPIKMGSRLITHLLLRGVGMPKKRGEKNEDCYLVLNSRVDEPPAPFQSRRKRGKVRIFFLTSRGRRIVLISLEV